MSSQDGFRALREAARGGMRAWIALLFGFDGAVEQESYLAVGATLMLAKYVLEALALNLWNGTVWTMPAFLSPLESTRSALHLSEGQLVALFVWTLPFLWIGFAMTLRRCRDAGFRLWLAFLYLVPFLNYAFMLLLCVSPSRTPTTPSVHAVFSGSRAKRAFASAAIALVVCGLVVAVDIRFFPSYGLAVFVAVPALLGALSSFLYNRGDPRPISENLSLCIGTVALGCGALILFAAEGAICVLMACPIVLALALIGTAFGRVIAQAAQGTFASFWPLPLVVVLQAALEHRSEPARFEVTTALEIAAPPETVWRHVVSFSELPEPDWLAFRLGIAYPIRARIEGTGVGAVRRCQFSTGDFVEPITAWDEPHRLAFDVAQCPPSMHEWSPYPNLHPPHLDGYIRSTRGEFRLVALDPGHTRLEGTTWYELRFQPALYWHWWSDAILHRIHGRVLAHIRALSEQD